MPAIYVPDVPEFRSLVDLASTRAECKVSALENGYYKIWAADAIEFTRKELRFNLAIWYGCLTGGIEGSIGCFDRERLRIVQQINNGDKV